VHNRRVQSETIDLIERVRSRLREVGQPFTVSGPASEEAVVAAEEQLGCPFPPSYRTFLRKYGSLSLPAEMAVVHDFVGIDVRAEDAKGVVERTLAARVENRLGHALVVVGLGAQAREWFCLDCSRSKAGGELPVVLFDARDNQVDQVFYEDFDSMVREVLEFVDDTLNHRGTEVSVG
jgi:hypothetical protein